MTGTGLAAIDHVVVLMMENRSLDNVLGWLYTPQNPPPRGQSFEGVEGGSIPVPPNGGPGGKSYLPSQGTVMTNPNPDPGEVYADVYNQQFNTQLPPQLIPNTTAKPPMTGFVKDYANHNPTHPEIIMQGFGPQSLPVINGLAAGFAVCDFWYSSIPTQTFCNRSYVHAGTSSGYVNNSWKTGPHFWDVGVFQNETPTVYNLLETAGVPWRIYYGSNPLLCNAWLTQGQIDRFFIPWDHDASDSRFFGMDQLKTDAATPDGSASGRNGLRSYSFIEPAFLDFPDYGPENDYHPPAEPTNLVPSNTLNGEWLLYQVYETLFGDKAPNRDKTLLIVIFDEHGGTFDHVPPPQTVSPDGVVIPFSQPGGSGFDFRRLGVRVPAVLISPLIPGGTVCHTPFDHTSAIATALHRFLPGKTLLARETAARDVGEVLTGPLRKDYPKITPRQPPTWQPEAAVNGPLLDFQVDMVLALAQKLGLEGDDLAQAAGVKTVGDAVAFVEPQLEALKRRRG